MNTAIVLMLGAGGVACALVGLTRLRLARLIEDTPTSRIRSAHQGYVEIKGKTVLNGQPPLYVPRLQIPCVWYRYEVIRDPGQSRHHDHQPDDQQSNREIYLDDGTGVCVVNSHLAQVFPRRTVDHTEIGVRHRMSWIGIGETVYTLGWMNTLHPAPVVHDVIRPETPDTPEARYGQLAEPLGRITRHPHKHHPFFIGANYEHKVINGLRNAAIRWLIIGVMLTLAATAIGLTSG